MCSGGVCVSYGYPLTNYVVLNFWTSFFRLPNTEITGVHHPSALGMEFKDFMHIGKHSKTCIPAFISLRIILNTASFLRS